jgi:hypothetical protein
MVPESEGGAHLDPAAAAETLKAHLLAALRPLTELPMRQLLDARYKKYRHIGEEGKYWQEQVRSGISDVFGLLAYAVSKMERSMDKSSRKPKPADGTPRRRLDKAKLPSATGLKRAERE